MCDLIQAYTLFTDVVMEVLFSCMHNVHCMLSYLSSSGVWEHTHRISFQGECLEFAT